jgi:hypothetical protein
MEFIFTILNVQKIKINIFQMRNAYKLLEDLCYIKYCVTELVLIDKYGDNYAILIGYKMQKIEDVIWLQEELEKYSFDFSNIYENFTDIHPTEFSERYQNFLSNNTQVLIYTLTNGQETNQTISFTAMMNRIPSTLFYVSAIKEDTIPLNLSERNLYDLMLNIGEKQSWSPAPDEIYSTTLTMSRLGLTIWSVGDGTLTTLGSDGLVSYETTDGKTKGKLVSKRTVNGDKTRSIDTERIMLSQDMTVANAPRWVKTTILVNNNLMEVEYLRESGEQ